MSMLGEANAKDKRYEQFRKKRFVERKPEKALWETMDIHEIHRFVMEDLRRRKGC